MANHTPGPWCADDEGMYVFGKSVGGCSMEEGEHMVAQIRGWGHLRYRGEAEAVEVQKANARLIAAAPDLLTALNDLLERYTSLVNCGDCGRWDAEKEDTVIAVRAALAKVI